MSGFQEPTNDQEWLDYDYGKAVGVAERWTSADWHRAAAAMTRSFEVARAYGRTRWAVWYTGGPNIWFGVMGMWREQADARAYAERCAQYEHSDARLVVQEIRVDRDGPFTTNSHGERWDIYGRKERA